MQPVNQKKLISKERNGEGHNIVLRLFIDLSVKLKREHKYYSSNKASLYKQLLEFHGCYSVRH